MMFLTGLYIFTFMTFTQLAKGQHCSPLDESLQKTWVDTSGIFLVTLTGTTLTFHGDVDGDDDIALTCWEEKDGFRQYRFIDPATGDTGHALCTKIVKQNLPGYFQMGIGIGASAFCVSCTLEFVISLTLFDGGNRFGDYEPEPAEMLTCNRPGFCPVTDPSDVLCPTASELELFCERLMNILNSESSEEDSSTENDDNDNLNEFRAILVGRAKVTEKIGQKGGVKGNGKGRKLGHCKKKLAEEIRVQCEPVPEPAIADNQRLN